MTDPVSILVNRARQLLRSMSGDTVDHAMIQRVISADGPAVSLATGHEFTPEEMLEASRRLETLFVVEQGPAMILTNEERRRPPQWYVGEKRQPGDLMKRYLQKLEEHDWPEESIKELTESTARVLEVLDDPAREGQWDWRGLVVGDVQSGKTAHYAGMINRAADAGYRVIVVLAGMHKVLRLQTQRRLDKDFLGWDTDPSIRTGSGGRVAVGVGEINPRPIIDCLTMARPAGDFNQRVADQSGFAPLNQPILLVVKKQGKVLQNLNRWIRGLPDASRAVPLLVVDDEADQASVDTGDQAMFQDGSFDEDYDPKRINGQIRKLLNAFSRSAYVAYTATPFANILMHDERRATDYGADLFPATFIASITPPDDYFGPLAVFGTNDAEYQGLPLIRYIRQTTEGWIPSRHDKTLRPRRKGQDDIPPSLHRAIDAFLLTSAARAARGQQNKHSSMLVHVSRFVDVHAEVHRQVERHLLERKALISGNDPQTIARLKKMWVLDFEKTTELVAEDPKFGRGLKQITWDQVRAHLADSTDKIEVLTANGSSKSDIDYDSYPNGRSLIAIGGDKLSRGLTLEGLSVSYFLRASRQYDSLLQMGRWFGYRRGFADLCRLYTTPDMEDWFRHVATATRDLRSQFAHMQLTGATPKEYGLRVESHSIMNVTADNKQRHAGQRASSYAGEGKIQTVLFRDGPIVGANAVLVDDFLASLGSGEESPLRPGSSGSRAGGVLWRGVSGQAVAELLAQFHFPPENIDIESDPIANYIRRQLGEGELTNWTVFIPSGNGTDVTVAGRTFGSVERTPRDDRSQDERYIIRTILSPTDEAIDLDETAFRKALGETKAQRLAQGKPDTDRPSGPDIRRARAAQNGLLLLYPLDPDLAGINTEQPVFGVMISFPESLTAQRRIYVENTVKIREQDS
jgi:hypothetical protein